MARTPALPQAAGVGRLARLAASSCLVAIAMTASVVVGCDGPGGRAGTPPAGGTGVAPSQEPTAAGAVPDAPVALPRVEKASRTEFDIP